MIISTTLAGPGAEDGIVDALRSCSGLVDLRLVLLSGVQERRLYAALERAPELADSTVFQHLEWTNDYGAARTAALRFAESHGATWALTVDCDERLAIPELPRQAMSEHWLSLAVRDSQCGYHKPRFLRCGAGLEWVGKSCERLLPERDMALVDGSFYELEKTPEQELARMERGVQNMPAMLAEDDHPQWRRHLAECLIGVGRAAEGEAEYRELARHPRANRELISWCHYRLAELEIGRGELELARTRIGEALVHDPGFIQEFGWLLAYIAAKQGAHKDAIMWATYALDAPVDLARGGHRSLTWEDGCKRLLESAHIVPSAPKDGWTREAFQGRREAFREDYASLARALAETISARNALDLGAGNGLLVEALTDAHVPVFGREASADAEEETPERLRGLIRFGSPLEQWGHGDVFHVVCCVEVAEHIEPTRADELIDAICWRCAPGGWVLFSAAQPGQGGNGHVNERPKSHWEAAFFIRGFKVDEKATQALVDSMGTPKRCWWLPRNVMLLKRS